MALALALVHHRQDVRGLVRPSMEPQEKIGS
jgi:hypothetical protein